MGGRLGSIEEEDNAAVQVGHGGRGDTTGMVGVGVGRRLGI